MTKTEISKNQLIYLASLYSLESTSRIRQRRFERVQKLTALMLKDGYIVFSPIVYNHPLAIEYKLPPGWDFWKRIDTYYVNRCDSMLILKDEGWKNSIGVTAEIKMAQKTFKKIAFVCFDGDNKYWFEEYIEL